MANPSMSKERAKVIVETVEQCLREGFFPRGQSARPGERGAVVETMRRIGLSPNSTAAVSRAETLFRAVDWSLYQAPETLAQEVQRRDDIALLRGQISSLERIVASERKLRHQLEATFASLVPPAPWRATKKPNASTLAPVLFTSDFQCGEVIRAREIDGINEYNSDIFVARYQAMVDKFIHLAKNHTGATDFVGCYYLRGGDAISGSIHDELAETNDLSAIPAVRLLQQHERAGIRRLREQFGRVRVISIPGNHGRTTPKPRAKRYHDLNFETLLTWWLADSFSDDPMVEFWSPPSGDAYFDVLGWKCLMSHGDRMGSRGGHGFIGPAATIARGHKRLFDNWTRTGRTVDYVLTGHLHTSLKLELGYANGALAGYSEYARDLRATPDSAKQWALFFHRDIGVSHAFELELSARPRRISEAPEAWHEAPASRGPSKPSRSHDDGRGDRRSGRAGKGG